jgi:hypothetical protein
MKDTYGPDYFQKLQLFAEFSNCHVGVHAAADGLPLALSWCFSARQIASSRFPLGRHGYPDEFWHEYSID